MEKNRINKPYLAAALLMALTTLVHIFAGGPENYAPLRASDLAAIPRATLSVVWHMVTLVLAVTAGGLFFLIKNRSIPLAILLLILQIGFALLLVFYGLLDFQSLLELPQWIAFGLASLLMFLGLRQ